jgi:ABC-type Fe3+-hydroxamate transport system substrate-binding protein
VNLERIRALRPDLILANLEENTRDMVEALDPLAPVYVTDVATLDDALAMILAVGQLTARADAAEVLANQIRQAFDALTPERRLRTVYLIWREPYMTVGGDTFIHDILARGGFANVFADCIRYPEVTLDAIAEARPDVVLLSSEPYPFSESHREA